MVSGTVTLIFCVHPSNFLGLYKQIVIKKKNMKRIDALNKRPKDNIGTCFLKQ